MIRSLCRSREADDRQNATPSASRKNPSWESSGSTVIWTKGILLVVSCMCQGSTQRPKKVADLLGAPSFISAPSSRDPLDVERALLSQILTWHQVMPQFVDFLLAFGMSEDRKSVV